MSWGPGTQYVNQTHLQNKLQLIAIDFLNIGDSLQISCYSLEQGSTEIKVSHQCWSLGRLSSSLTYTVIQWLASVCQSMELIIIIMFCYNQTVACSASSTVILSQSTGKFKIHVMGNNCPQQTKIALNIYFMIYPSILVSFGNYLLVLRTLPLSGGSREWGWGYSYGAKKMLGGTQTDGQTGLHSGAQCRSSNLNPHTLDWEPNLFQ